VICQESAEKPTEAPATTSGLVKAQDEEKVLRETVNSLIHRCFICSLTLFIVDFVGIGEAVIRYYV
jgi:hypothetical protein